MNSQKIVFLIVLAASFLAHAAPDQNGLEKKALYTITTAVGGKKLAWTHVVPKDQPKNLIGTSPAKEKVELLPLVEGEKSQLWLMKSDSETEPSYQIFSRISAPEDNPHSPAMVVDVNGDFADDDDNKFHDKYNRITVGLNQSSTDRVWMVQKQPNGKYTIQSFLGVKGRLRPKGDTYGFGEERVLEAFKTTDGSVKLRHKIPSKAEGQFWTLTKQGYL